MPDNPLLDAAMDRLGAAIDALEGVVERRLGRERQVAGMEAQVQALGIDRARLAAELDHATYRADGLETASRDVSRRLTNAMETIRVVLDGTER
jgi:hypothetical protein